MHVREVRLLSAPGLRDGLVLTDLHPGLNIIVGPNAAGKSTLSRTVRGMLWASVAPDNVMATSTWVSGDEILAAELAHGRSTWRPRVPSTPPDDSADRYALDLHLLQAAQKADVDFARKLAVELSGGYDVTAAMGAFTITGTIPTTLARERTDAQAGLYTATNAVEDLVSEEQRLPELRRRLALAHSAQGLLQDVGRTVELARKRAQLASCQAQLTQFPPGIEDLKGDEIEDLERLGERRQRALESRKLVQAEIRDLESHAAGLAFPGDEPTEEELNVQRARSRKLQEDERDLAQADLDLAEARESEADARKVLLSGETELDRVPEESLRTLERLVERRAEAHRAWEAEREVNRALRARSDNRTDDPQKLRRAVDSLRRWLRITPAGAVHPTVPITWMLAPLITGLILVVVGVLIPQVLVGAVGGVGVGIGILLISRKARSQAPPAPGDARVKLQRGLEQLGMAPPIWDEASAEIQLAELEDRLTRALELGHIEARLGESTEHLTALETDAKERERELGIAIEGLGLAAGLPDLSLIQQASALRSWLDAKNARAAAEGRRRELAQRMAEALGAIRAWTETLGGRPPEEAASAAETIERVDGQRRDLKGARDLLRSKRSEMARAQAEAESDDFDYALIWQKAGVPEGDERALRDRVDLHGPWSHLLSDSDGLQRAVDALQASLAVAARFDAWGVEDPTRVDEATAFALEAKIKDEAKLIQELSAESRSIEDRLKAASGGTSMEDARTRLNEAEIAVDDARERATLDLLACLVLEDARAAHEIAYAPPVLAKAQEWFSRFTHHTFRLWVDTETDARLTAVDERSKARRELRELSDATRVQLLLAGRLAAIQEGEGTAGPLPISLDEVLATTDAARFRKIAESLLELADEGRQILYFTADYGESSAWEALCQDLGREAPRVIDLGKAGGTEAGWGNRGPAAIPSLPDVPAPTGLTADEYASKIGVPAPNGHRPVGDWHLFHVLYDELAALSALLRARIDRIGPFRAATSAGSGVGLIEESVTRRAAARADLLEATLDLWSVGRGRPVTWDEVEQSGAISPTFTDRVKEVLSRQADDPRQFMDEVRGLKRFHTKASEQLEEHLELAMVLDNRERIEPGLIAQRAVARLATATEEGPLTAEEATAYVLGILDLLAT